MCSKQLFILFHKYQICLSNAIAQWCYIWSANWVLQLSGTKICFRLFSEWWKVQLKVTRKLGVKEYNCWFIRSTGWGHIDDLNNLYSKVSKYLEWNIMCRRLWSTIFLLFLVSFSWQDSKNLLSAIHCCWKTHFKSFRMNIFVRKFFSCKAANLFFVPLLFILFKDFCKYFFYK